MAPGCRRAAVAFMLALWPALVGAQEVRTVTGRVTARESLQPLASVHVAVKGTNIATLTDGQGNFTLRVPANASTLVVSSLGYRTVETAIRDQVAVVLEIQAIGLEGLTVTALGIQREKRTLGYSVQDITGADVTRVPKMNIVTALQGTIAGVHVTDAGPTGGSARVVIRGANSITGNNQPLFVVDGVPLDNSSPRNTGFGGVDWGNAVQDLDASNIESISVLKGPNAAALYGSRASNGAIVITTKSGRGPGSGGYGITATQSFTFETPLRLPNYQNLYGQGISGEFAYVDGRGGGVWDHVDESWGPRLDGRTAGCVFIQSDDPRYNPQNPYAYDTSEPCRQFTGVGLPWRAHPDNVRNFFETGAQRRTNVSVARSTDNANVRLSVSNDGVQSMAPGNTFDRTGVLLRGGAALSARISAEASLNYNSLGVDNRMGTGYDENNPMQSFIWFGRQVDMNALRNYRCDDNAPHACTEGGQFNWNYNYHNNPYWEQHVNWNRQERDRLTGHVETRLQVNDWITLTGRVGRDWYREMRKDVTEWYSLDDAGSGSFRESNRVNSETNMDVVLAATRQLSPAITLDVTGGANARENMFDVGNVTVSHLTSPGIFTIANAASPPNPTSHAELKKVHSLFGSLSANYNGWFNVDVTGRNDWSSTLPVENRSYFYPSVSSAFVFTDAFGLESDLLSSGKLRASWTRVGNDTDPYQLASVFQSQQSWGGIPMFTLPNALANAGLKPEQTTAWEMGADIGFFNERMGFVLTYYDSRTRDQILGVQTSAATGFTSQFLNAGEIHNKGWELLLRTTPVARRNLRWDMTVNWSKNNSLVADLYGDTETQVLGTYWSMNIEARKGQPYGSFFGNGYLTCGDTQISANRCAESQRGMRLLNASGYPQTDPVRRILGNYNPDWNGGIQNRISYGPVELAVLVDGQSGGNIFSVTNWFGEYAGVLQSTIRGRENDWCDPGIVVRGVLPNGQVNGEGGNEVKVCPENYFARNFGNQEAGIDDASYIKLREVRIGYQLPSRLMNRIGFSGGEVGLVGRNLALWSRMENIDPETAFDASNAQGIEFGQHPTARSIGFNITIRP
jgi:TonB-linked SusC/RagA family outer membrane protein